MTSLKNASMTAPLYQVVVREEAPFVMTSTDRSGKVSYSGLAIDLLEQVAQKALFRYNIRLTPHVSYGFQDHSGKWQGLISELTDKKADLAVGPIPITANHDLMDKVDYTKPFMSSSIRMLIKYPSATSSRGINLMLEPFAAEVWVMICLAFIVISLAMFLIGRFSPYEWARISKDKDPRLARTSFSLKNSFLFAASTLSWQGYREAPRSISGRILMCMWFMFTVFVLVAYTACLCAILTTRGEASPQKVPFSNYDDIMDNQILKLGAVKYGHVYSLLKAGKMSHDTLFAKLFTYVENSQEWIQDLNEGVQRVKDSGGKYALLMESAKADYVTTTNCDLITYGDSLASFGYGFATTKNSPLMDSLRLAILKTIDERTLAALHNKYYKEKSVCPELDKSRLVPNKGGHSDHRVASSMDMRDMAIPFLFFFLGVLGAGGALGAELYYKKRMAIKKDPDNKARQPLNTETSKSKAPTTSPPPPPIYKVNNKLQDTGKDKQKKLQESPEVNIEVDSSKDIEKGMEMIPLDDKVDDEESGVKDEPAVQEDVKVDIVSDDKSGNKDPAEVTTENA